MHEETVASAVQFYGLLDLTTRTATRTSKKTNRFNKQNNNFTRASHFFCTFLSRFCTTTTWKCLMSRCMENVSKQRRNLISLSEPGNETFEFSFRRVRQDWTNFKVGKKNRYKYWKNANSLFKRRSRCRRVVKYFLSCSVVCTPVDFFVLEATRPKICKRYSHFLLHVCPTITTYGRSSVLTTFFMLESKVFFNEL